MPSVLVVDDEPYITDIVSFYLGQRGFEVEVLNDTRRVMEVLSRRPFDVLILDHMMPHILGMDLAEQLRRDPRFAALPILLLTGKVITLEDRERCLRAHVLIHAKPFTSGGLFEKVSQMMERRSWP